MPRAANTDVPTLRAHCFAEWVGCQPPRPCRALPQIRLQQWLLAAKSAQTSEPTRGLNARSWFNAWRKVCLTFSSGMTTGTGSAAVAVWCIHLPYASAKQGMNSTSYSGPFTASRTSLCLVSGCGPRQSFGTAFRSW